MTWRVTRAGISHAITTHGRFSLCGLARRADLILSWRGEIGTVECKECARLADHARARDS